MLPPPVSLYISVLISGKSCSNTFSKVRNNSFLNTFSYEYCKLPSLVFFYDYTFRPVYKCTQNILLSFISPGLFQNQQEQKPDHLCRCHMKSSGSYYRSNRSLPVHYHLSHQIPDAQLLCTTILPYLMLLPNDMSIKSACLRLVANLSDI